MTYNNDCTFKEFFYRCVTCKYWFYKDKEKAYQEIIKKINNKYYNSIYAKCYTIFDDVELCNIDRRVSHNEIETIKVAPKVPHHFGCIYYSFECNEILDLDLNKI